MTMPRTAETGSTSRRAPPPRSTADQGPVDTPPWDLPDISRCLLERFCGGPPERRHRARDDLVTCTNEHGPGRGVPGHARVVGHPMGVASGAVPAAPAQKSSRCRTTGATVAVPDR